jgi:hypothetical protein
MASSDSTRKVARVASRSGNATGAKQGNNWLFPVAIVAIIAIGASIVFIARGRNEGYSGNSTAPRAQLSPDSTSYDHWHAAFAVNVCGEEVPPLADAIADELGIHTHQDGLVHIHPFSVQAAGKRATMQRFFNQVGIEISGDKVTLPVEFKGNRTLESGVTTCGGEPAEWVLAHWDTANAAVNGAPDKITRSDFGSVRFSEDLGAFTLAFVPVGSEDIAGPSAAAQIDILGQCDGENPPPQCKDLLGQGQGDPTVQTIPEVTETSIVDDAPADTTPTTAAGS